jgi:catechol 2,3-dioxygenase-like lactoylglutathione lyase family enzyme
MVDAIEHVTVGVADMAPVRALWIDQFGLEIVADRQGPDAGLAKLWGIPANQIEQQLMLGTPGAQTGRLHFVQFRDPAPPVRSGAMPTDLGPKNIDVNCVDMSRCHAALEAAGYTFRSAISDYEVDNIQVREVQMPGHDDTNIVLLQVSGEEFEIEFSPAGCGAMTSFVTIVPDTRSESSFYQAIFGLDEIMHHRLGGATIEEIIGLPKGAMLEMRVMGREGSLFGRMELIEYGGLSGKNRFDLANAPATGALHVGFAVPSVSEFVASARESGYAVDVADELDLLYGANTVAALKSPAGLRIEVFEHARV